MTLAGIKAYQAGKHADAIKSFEDARKVARQLFNTAEYPDGHTNLATSLNNLAALYEAQGKYADAEPLYKDALVRSRRRTTTFARQKVRR